MGQEGMSSPISAMRRMVALRATGQTFEVSRGRPPYSMGHQGIGPSTSSMRRMVSFRATTDQTSEVSSCEEKGHPSKGQPFQ